MHIGSITDSFLKANASEVVLWYENERNKTVDSFLEIRSWCMLALDHYTLTLHII